MTDRKQQERRQRGEDFQDEMRRSWRHVKTCWRMRISDKNNGTRPADDLVILSSINVLAEYKRTNDNSFKLSIVRPNQQKALYDFDAVIRRNKGIVFISFLRDSLDVAYAFRFIDALRYMRNMGVQYIHIDDFKTGAFRCVELPLRYDENDDRYYDLKGVEMCYK